jgi:16S rRNA (guanine1207-N2)-methyltransferase
MDILIDVPQGRFKLQRLPNRKNELLRAWDTADEYLLKHIFDNIDLPTASRILILNDTFGALAVALSVYNPIAISDSYLSQQATRINLAVNKLSEESVQLENSLQWPIEKVDLVLIKVPKTLALLEDQLIRLQALLTEKTIVIAAGMVKSMPSTAWKLMDRYLGKTMPSLARKKARLIFVNLNQSQESYKNPYPIYYQLENTDYQICNHANVFSRDSLDIGTRFLLKHLPRKTEAKAIVDLGCGNGVVGLMLATYHKSATLFFIDESYMAVASAKENYQQAFSDRTAEFSVADGLVDSDSETKDLIVCNPPFHQQHTKGNQVALSLFKQSYRALKKGGELWVIGNRHLKYAADLKNIFSACDVVASNEKFTVWKVVK